MEEESKYLRTRIPKSLHLDFKREVLEVDGTIESITAQLIKDWVDSRRKTTQQAPPDPNGLTQLLSFLAADERPSDPDLIELAHDLGVNPVLLLKVRDRLFPTKRNGYANQP